MSEISYSEMDREIDGIRTVLICAMRGDAVVGSVELRLTAVASMRGLFVTPEERGKGIAMALLKLCERIARPASCYAINWTCAANNYPALALYAKWCADIFDSNGSEHFMGKVLIKLAPSFYRDLADTAKKGGK